MANLQNRNKEFFCKNFIEIFADGNYTFNQFIELVKY